MEIRESEAQYIREAYRRVLDEGQAMYATAKWLSTEGVPTAGKAQLWTRSLSAPSSCALGTLDYSSKEGQEVEDSQHERLHTLRASRCSRLEGVLERLLTCLEVRALLSHRPPRG